MDEEKILTYEMSMERFAHSTGLTPVKVPEPVDLDGGQSNRTTRNGGRCSALSRIFQTKRKKRTKVKTFKVESNEPTVSSVDGAPQSKPM